MPYKRGDQIEIRSDRNNHGFPVGTKVRVTQVLDNDIYKVDSDDDGRKRSQYVHKEDLVKRREK